MPVKESMRFEGAVEKEKVPKVSFEEVFLPPEITEKSDKADRRVHDMFEYEHLHFGSDRISVADREIRDCINQDTDKPVEIYSGTGAVLQKEREIGTEKMVGCVTVFARGPEANAMFHMTPKERLPYEGAMAEDSVKRILEALSGKGGVPLNEYEFTIIFNSSNRDDDYKDIDDLKRLFAESGVAKLNTAEVPLNETSVYYSPERPNDIFTFGSALYRDGENVEISKWKKQGFWIALNTKKSLKIDIPTPKYPEAVFYNFSDGVTEKIKRFAKDRGISFLQVLEDTAENHNVSVAEVIKKLQKIKPEGVGVPQEDH